MSDADKRPGGIEQIDQQEAQDDDHDGRGAKLEQAR